MHIMYLLYYSSCRCTINLLDSPQRSYPWPKSGRANYGAAQLPSRLVRSRKYFRSVGNSTFEFVFAVCFCSVLCSVLQCILQCFLGVIFVIRLEAESNGKASAIAYDHIEQ